MYTQAVRQAGLELPGAAPRVPCALRCFAVAQLLLGVCCYTVASACSLLTGVGGPLLLQALRKARGKLLEGLQGMWCDAIPLLIETEWSRARGALLQPHAPFTTHAVQAWMQVGSLQAAATSGWLGFSTALCAGFMCQAMPVLMTKHLFHLLLTCC